MSLLLAILRTLAPPVPDTGNKFGGGMFVRAMYDRRKRTKAPPRFIDRYDLVTKGNESSANGENMPADGNISPGRNLLPVQSQPKITRAKPVRSKHKPVIDLITFAEGGVARANAERMMKAELEIQARRNLNDAIAVLLLLAS